jgi:hypothetical protein
MHGAGIASALVQGALAAAAHAGHGDCGQSRVRQAGAARVTASVATLLDQAKCLVDVGQGAAGGCQQPSMNLVAYGVRQRGWGCGVELAELIESEVSLSHEKALRGSDELRRERARR